MQRNYLSSWHAQSLSAAHRQYCDPPCRPFPLVRFLHSLPHKGLRSAALCSLQVQVLKRMQRSRSRRRCDPRLKHCNRILIIEIEYRIFQLIGPDLYVVHQVFVDEPFDALLLGFFAQILKRDGVEIGHEPV